MSAYITLKTPMLDEECLLEALVAVGFRRSAIEVHSTPVALVGYEGMAREQQAHVVIKRGAVGPGSNELGFLRAATGYQAIVSEYDRSRYGPDWMSRLYEAYQGSAERKRERLVAAQRAAVEQEARRAAEEIRRMQETQRQLVEAQRQAIHEKARKLGYRVTEERTGEKVKLVLVKRVY